MLQLIRNNSPFTVLILFIYSLLIRLPALSHPLLPEPVEGLPVYNFILAGLRFLLGENAFAFTLLAVLMLFIQALYLNTIVIRRRLAAKPTHIPVFGFLTLTALYPGLAQFSNILIANWCLLGALDMMLRFSQPANQRKYIYNAGLLVGLAMLFHFGIVGLIPLLFISLLLLRSFNPREWLIIVLGLVTPVYFLSGILFLTDRLGELHAWPDSIQFSPFNWSIYTLVTVIVLILLCGVGLFVLQQQLLRAAVFVRRSWAFVVCLAVMTVAVGFLLVQKGGGLLAIPASTLIIVQPIYWEKYPKLAYAVIWLMLGLMVFCQLPYIG